MQAARWAYRLYRRRATLDFVSSEHRIGIFLREVERNVRLSQTIERPPAYDALRDSLDKTPNSALIDEGRTLYLLWEICEMVDSLTIPRHLKDMIYDDVDEVRRVNATMEHRLTLLRAIRSTYGFLKLR
mmetsp:Transcript_92/g.218  ORF Transcript_92/g.218 Transcript_92/m.218 type:complete len:129 (-) Transcript_92:162-548(-)